MISCPFCYGINSDDAKFCEFCGKRLDETPKSEVQPESVEKETVVEPEVSEDATTVIDWEDVTKVLAAEAEEVETVEETPMPAEEPATEVAEEPEKVEEPWKQRRLEQERKAAERNNKKSVSIKIPDNVKNVDLKSTLSKENRKPGMEILLVEIAALVIMVIAFAVIGSSSSSPKSVAKKYMEAIFKNDWESAYECLDIQESTFLTEEGYAALYKDGAFTVDVTNMKVTEQKSLDRDTFVKYCDVEYRLRGSSEPYTYTVTLVKQEHNNMLFFPSWKVSSSNEIVYDYGIYAPHGAQVTFDGILLTEEHLSSSNLDGLDEYRIDVFVGSHTVKVAAPWCKVQELQVEAYSGSDCYATTVTLAEGAEEVLVSQGRDALAKLYEAAMADADYSEVSDLFATDMSERYEQFKDGVIGQEGRAMTELSIDSFEGEEVYYLSDAEYGSGLCISIDYDYDYDYYYTYRGWFSDTTTTRFDSKSGWSEFTAAFIWNGETYQLSWIDVNSVF